MSRIGITNTAAGLACAVLSIGSGIATAALPTEPPGQVQSLPQPIPPHWTWVNDFVFPHMVSGKAMLVDGDKGLFVGQLDTGFGAMRVERHSRQLKHAKTTESSAGHSRTSGVAMPALTCRLCK